MNYYRIIKVLFLSAIIVVVAGCSDSHIRVRRSLRLAGENGKELRAVLNHYKGDREKMAAARFLIANMPGHVSLQGDWQGYYSEIDSLISPSTGIPIDNIADTISACAARHELHNAQDLLYITADYLIKDIDKAFELWKEGEWASPLTFDEFCDWLLPYTVSQGQPLSDWRNDKMIPAPVRNLDTLVQCDDFVGDPRPAIIYINKWCIPRGLKHQWGTVSGAPRVYDLERLVRYPIATCDDYSNTFTLAMRGIGIPLVIDYVPRWPDRDNGHSWCATMSLKGQEAFFSPFVGNPDKPDRQYSRLAKVCRRTYSSNAEYLKLLKRTKGKVPVIHKHPFFKDVTDHYLRTSDITVELLPNAKTTGRDIYIGIFDDASWQPVWYGRRKGRHATFKGMGRNITYIALDYDGHSLRTVSDPFELRSDGSVRYFRKKEGLSPSFRIRSKYPQREKISLIFDFIRGGWLEGADNPSFTGSEKVASFKELALNSGSVRVRQSRPYRYWRLNTNPGQVTDMADIILYGEGEVRLRVDSLCRIPEEVHNLFDGDPLTNYRIDGSSPPPPLCFDKPVTLDHVSYIRRGDGNSIVPGDRYQVLYWDDNRWNVCKDEIAKDVYLDLDDVPSGVLCLIRGLSRGKDDRIFNYEEEKGIIDWH